MPNIQQKHVGLRNFKAWSNPTQPCSNAWLRAILVKFLSFNQNHIISQQNVLFGNPALCMVAVGFDETTLHRKDCVY